MGRVIKLFIYFFVYQFIALGIVIGVSMIVNHTGDIPDIRQFSQEQKLWLQILAPLLLTAHLLGWKYVKRSEHEPFVRNISNGSFVKESFIVQGKNEMYAAIVETPPHADSGSYSHHGGEEMVFVLEGCLTFYLEGHKPYKLEPYDTLYYPNYIGHRWSNDSEEPVRMLMVSTSPYNF